MTRVVELRCSDARAEVMADLLFVLGATAVEERATGRGGVVLVSDVDGAAVAHLRERGADVREVELDDGWRRRRPAGPGSWSAGRFVVHAPGADAEAPAGCTVLTVDPGDAFGSGSHPSSRLCLRLLDRLSPAVLAGGRVLDVGCGSGVLSVAALARSARSVDGIDPDPAALVASRRTARLNGCSDRFEATGAPLGSVRGRYDVVMANLIVPLVEELGGELVAHLAPGGALVVGGLLEGHRLRARDATAPLRLVDELAESGWLALTLAAGGPPPP